MWNFLTVFLAKMINFKNSTPFSNQQNKIQKKSKVFWLKTISSDIRKKELYDCFFNKVVRCSFAQNFFEFSYSVFVWIYLNLKDFDNFTLFDCCSCSFHRSMALLVIRKSFFGTLRLPNRKEIEREKNMNNSHQIQINFWI